MGRCLIFGAMYAGEWRTLFQPTPGDLVICADAGYARALEHDIAPDLVVGDFDSMPMPQIPEEQIVKLPVRKDDTDTLRCIREGRKRGYRKFHIAGGIGGRFDHTFANLQCLADCAGHGEEAWLYDSNNRMCILSPGAYSFKPEAEAYLSLFAYTEKVSGICLHGTEWELEDATLTQDYPLGCSNWFRDREVELSFREGLLLLILASDGAQHGKNGQ
ncbi:MAG: thiamine diphosphokinase [Clostridia bacterium]|nr:thiamine diphosphokinase [Clostridia bacterium]